MLQQLCWAHYIMVKDKMSETIIILVSIQETFSDTFVPLF